MTKQALQGFMVAFVCSQAAHSQNFQGHYRQLFVWDVQEFEGGLFVNSLVCNKLLSILAFLTEMVHFFVAKYIYNFQPLLTRTEVSSYLVSKYWFF